MNRQKVLERILSVVETQEVARHIDSNLLKKLEICRFGDQKKKPRGKKVPAGQSYTAELEESSEEEEQDDPISEEEEEENDDNEIEQQELDEEELPDLDRPYRKAGTYVVAMYKGQWFLAEVCEDQKNVGKGYVRLNYMVIRHQLLGLGGQTGCGHHTGGGHSP